MLWKQSKRVFAYVKVHVRSRFYWNNEWGNLYTFGIISRIQCRKNEKLDFISILRETRIAMCRITTFKPIAGKGLNTPLRDGLHENGVGHVGSGKEHERIGWGEYQEDMSSQHGMGQSRGQHERGIKWNRFGREIKECGMPKRVGAGQNRLKEVITGWGKSEWVEAN